MKSLQIKDLPANQKITREEMRRITGGFMAFGFTFGCIPGKSALGGDYKYYVHNGWTGNTTYY